MKKMAFLCFIGFALNAIDDDLENVDNQAVVQQSDAYLQNLHMVDQQTLEASDSLDVSHIGCCASCRDFYTSCLNEGPVLCPQTERETAFCTTGLVCGAFTAIMCLFGM